MQVWVVRDSNCGNGNDDPGVVLGVFASVKEAEEYADSCPMSKERCYEIDIEGPFELKGAQP